MIFFIDRLLVACSPPTACPFPSFSPYVLLLHFATTTTATAATIINHHQRSPPSSFSSVTAVPILVFPQMARRIDDYYSRVDSDSEFLQATDDDLDHVLAISLHRELSRRSEASSEFTRRRSVCSAGWDMRVFEDVSGVTGGGGRCVVSALIVVIVLP